MNSGLVEVHPPSDVHLLLKAHLLPGAARDNPENQWSQMCLGGTEISRLHLKVKCGETQAYITEEENGGYIRCAVESATRRRYCVVTVISGEYRRTREPDYSNVPLNRTMMKAINIHELAKESQ